MKPILIIYPFYSQRSLMANYSNRLNKKGFVIDVLCLNNGELICQSAIKWNYLALYVLKLSEFRHNNIITAIISLFFRWLFANIFFSKIVKSYELVDFHSFTSLEYIWLMKKTKSLSIPYDITLWGSDVLRAPAKTFKRRRNSYLNCREIKGGGTLISTLQCHYGNLLDDKYRENYFGNSELDIIDGINDTKYSSVRDKLFPQTEGKLLVVCGYNNQPAQRHFVMLEAISQLKDEIKERIHIVLPLTYPLKGDYLNDVKNKAESIGVSYTVLMNYLSEEEVAVLRKSSNITVNIQTTDSFAGSIQSHLYCQNVVLLGEWLNYPLYDKNNVFYIKTSLDNLSERIADAIDNFATYKLRSLPNKQLIKDMVSWESRIEGWAESYREIVV